MLGVGRSGTTWLSTVLSKTPTPLRFVSEHLYKYRPVLKFSNHYERTAIPYTQYLGYNHPLVNAYRTLLIKEPDFNRHNILQDTLLRNDQNWEYCLVKEVHSLLATEALLDMFNCKSVLIVRDPVYCVDSLLYRDGGSSSYLLAEENHIFGKTNTSIELRIKTAQYLNNMLKDIANRYSSVFLVEYEKLCNNPFHIFGAVAEHLGLEWSNSCAEFLKETMQYRVDSTVYRDTRIQANRPLKYISRRRARTLWQNLRYSE